MEQNGIWTERLQIRASMVDTTRRASLTAICNFLQEAAGNHAHQHRIGYCDMLVKNRFWALNRLQVEMTEYPAWQETLAVRTWVHLMKGPFSFRNFELLDSNQQRIGSASTLWALLDAGSRRPVRIDAGAFPVLAGKLPIRSEPPKITEIARSEHPVVYQTRYSDLDMVKHVNNVKYLEWILDTYDGAQDHRMPGLLEVNYLRETHFRDSLSIHSQQAGKGQFLHRIILNDTNTEVLRAKIIWRKRIDKDSISR